MAYIKKTDQTKPWAKKISAKRTAKKREIKNIFTIYCEGENTEPGYFKSFPVNTETEVQAIGLGMSKTALVKKVIEELNNRKYLRGQKKYDADRQIWCVFDFDKTRKSNEKQDFNNAVQIAEEKQIKVAYSNDSFELWFILHYQYIDSELSRDGYYKILSKHFRFDYEKKGKNLDQVKNYYEKLKDKMDTAIENANNLEKIHKKTLSPSDQIPITKVHKLVMELKKCLKS